jgi:opacity protein-like surface antigen
LKKAAILFCLTVLFSLCAVAQSSSTGPSAELGFGYAHLTGDVGKNGWNATGALNFSHRWGIEADFGGYYGKDSILGFNVNNDVYTYTFGPKVMFTTGDERVTPFAHLLFGGGHESADTPLGSQSDSAFTWMLGGGADLNLAHNWAARGKIDFVRTNFFDNGDTHARLGVGIVYKWSR